MSKHLDIFRENGRLISEIRNQLVDFAKSNPDKAAIDKQAEMLIKKAGGVPAFQKVDGYNWSTCICVNDEFVHGIPKGKINPGDIVTIDIGMFYKGTTTDTATTFILGQADEATQTFLQVGRDTLKQAVNQAQPGNTISDISRTIQTGIESAGYTVTRDLVGHGLGKTMHERPQIPCIVNSSPDQNVIIKPGMILAIEVMYMMGNWHLTKDDDNWTMRTADGSLSAMFETDVIITKSGPEIITPGVV